MEPLPNVRNDAETPTAIDNFLLSLDLQGLQAFSASGAEESEIVRSFLSREFDQNALPIAINRGLDGLAMEAARRDNVNFLRFVLHYGTTQNTTLVSTIAARNNSIHILEFLDEENVQRADILAAVRARNWEAFDFLWNRLSPQEKQRFANTVLDVALDSNFPRVVLMLLSSSFSLKPKLKRAVSSGNAQLVRKFLQRFPQTQVKLEKGLEHAWRNGYFEVAQELLSWFPQIRYRKILSLVERRSVLTKQQKRQLLLSMLSPQQRELVRATEEKDVDKVSELVSNLNSFENDLGRTMALAVVDDPRIHSLLDQGRPQHRSEALKSILS